MLANVEIPLRGPDRRRGSHGDDADPLSRMVLKGSAVLIQAQLGALVLRDLVMASRVVAADGVTDPRGIKSVQGIIRHGFADPTSAQLIALTLLVVRA